jgi:V-type H+-transporting ATPase subunit H
LVAITEMLADPSASATTLPLYHDLRSSEHPDDPYGPLVKCLGQEEEFAVLAALRLLGLLVAYVYRLGSIACRCLYGV